VHQVNEARRPTRVGLHQDCGYLLRAKVAADALELLVQREAFDNIVL
jgi:hypothetical protein